MQHVSRGLQSPDSPCRPPLIGMGRHEAECNDLGFGLLGRVILFVDSPVPNDQAS